MNKVVIVVDGYSSGAGFATALNKLGVECVHVHSQAKVPPVYKHQFDFSPYISDYHYEVRSHTNLLNQLLSYKPTAIIAGAESGVPLADKLAQDLSLPGNNPNSSCLRRDKFAMQKAIARAGLKSIDSRLFFEIEGCRMWLESRECFSLPLVVKPVNSVGGDGVEICHTKENAYIAVKKIFKQETNALGLNNDGVIIQPFIKGKEYVINTVSCDGIHKLCEIWEYERLLRDNGSRQIYDIAKVVEYSPSEHRDLIEYAFKVNSALGVEYGPAHLEIIKNEKNCFLVELGARLMGSGLPFELMSESITTSQAASCIDFLLSTDNFWLNKRGSYALKKYIVALFMVSNFSGKISKVNHINELKKLHSFYKIKFSASVGNQLEVTIDYATSPGMIFLAHEDFSIIKQDILKIREMEKTMFSFCENSERIEV